MSLISAKVLLLAHFTSHPLLHRTFYDVVLTFHKVLYNAS